MRINDLVITSSSDCVGVCGVVVVDVGDIVVVDDVDVCVSVCGVVAVLFGVAVERSVVVAEIIHI